MPLLYIIRGIPGTGKTTLANALVGKRFARAADDFPGIYQNGIYQHALRAKARSWCLQEIEELMCQQQSPIAVNNTFVYRKSLIPYLELAQHYGYAVQIITCEVCIKPNGNKCESIHNVPQGVVENLAKAFEKGTF